MVSKHEFEVSFKLSDPGFCTVGSLASPADALARHLTPTTNETPPLSVTAVLSRHPPKTAHEVRVT